MKAKQARKLTDGFIRNVKPPNPEQGDKPQVVYIDTMERGLALLLVVSYGGTKTFRVLTYKDGKPKTHKLGTYPALTLKEAFKRARAYYENPQKFAEQAETGTFKDIAQKWIRRHVDENKLRSKPEIERMLDKYVYPKWANTKFLEIRRLQVNELLDHIVDNHGRSQADAVLAVIRGVCNWYASRSEHYESPIVPKMKRDRRKLEDRARKRFLNDNEIRVVWEAAKDCGQFGALVQLALLTGQRRGRFGEKSTAMRWSEISKDGVWAFSQEERRKAVATQIKLPPMALKIIKEQSKVDGNPFVFSGKGKGPFNHFSQGMDLLREKLPDVADDWTIHDLRRTARKLMSRAGVRPDVGELVLGHSIKGIRAVYDDVTEYQPLIDQAVQAITNVVDQIVNGAGDNVVPLRGRG